MLALSAKSLSNRWGHHIVCSNSRKPPTSLSVAVSLKKMGVSPKLVQDVPPIIKAPSDKRLYEMVHLRNGLAVLLIHDPLMFEGNDSHEDETEDDEDEDSDDESGSEGEDEDEDDEVDDEGGHTMGCDACDGDEHSDHTACPKSKQQDGNRDTDDSDEEGTSRSHEGASKSGMVLTKKAAAAMCVGVGSFSDPPDAQGLAHFLEHMLFMGSSKFPDENEYDNFLSKHGGGSNAFTETEYTYYHFDINRMFLKPALDRFSQFFISPLAKVDAMGREVQAIDSEFNQVLQSDSCRLLQLQCHTADPSHPFHAFTWGNKKSLSEPMARGVDVRGKMLNLYKEHYLAGRMKLAVLGGEPLETLKEWVVELFGEVRAGVSDRLCFPWNGRVWEAGKMYRVESVKDQHLLSLMWPLPCLEAAYLKKPQDYISHLIGHEGAGSLLSLLKEKGWATALSAGVGEGGYEQNTAGFLFDVDICLTVSGLDKVLDVVDLFYQYLKMLRDIGPQKWVFEELQSMGMMEFKFAEEISADNYVVRLASNMHVYKEQHVIYGDYAFEEWKPTEVSDLLALISPDNMRLDILTKSFDRHAPGVKFEPWFEVPFTVETIPSNLMENWRNPPMVDHGLHMPVVNEFIPTDFSIYTGKSDTATDEMEDFPSVLILEEPSVKVWCKLDRTFKTPRANTYFAITCRSASESVKASVLTEIYINTLEDALNETIYLANVAKLESSMSVSGAKIELKLFGFNEKLPVLASKIAEIVMTFVPSEDRFQAIKEDLERVYRNTNMKPLKHSAYLRLQILKERFFDVDDKLECLLSLTREDVIQFIPLLFDQTYMEGLCHGNLSEEAAVNIVNIFKGAFVQKGLPANLRPNELVINLPTSVTHIFEANVKNKSEENSVVEMYFQVDQDFGLQSLKVRAILDLFGEIAYEPCFNQLRTKEQLGYRVDCGVRVTHGILGFCFRVQSSKYSPVYLHERINNFIGSMRQILADLSHEEFENYKEALVAEKMERYHSLVDETDRHWEQIWDQRYIFEARKLEALEVQTLKKSDILDFFAKHIDFESPSRRELVVHIWGCNMQRNGEEQLASRIYEQTCTTIKDLGAFKGLQNFFSC